MQLNFYETDYSQLASSVSSAIVQRYLNHVLDAALCQNIQIQSVAIDVLSFTIKQGLAHPLQVRHDDDLHRATLIFIFSLFLLSSPSRLALLPQLATGPAPCMQFSKESMHLFSTLDILSVPGHPLIIRRKCLSTQYKVIKTSYHLNAPYTCSRFPLATYTHRSSPTMVFARP